MNPARSEPRRRPASGLILAYLALQVLLPLRALLRDKFETRGNFSWNMFAHVFVCKAVYARLLPDASLARIDYRKYLQDPRYAVNLLHQDALRAWHPFLCGRDDLPGGPGPIVAVARCSLDGGPERDVVGRGADVCARSSP